MYFPISKTKISVKSRLNSDAVPSIPDKVLSILEIEFRKKRVGNIAEVTSLEIIKNNPEFDTMCKYP